ncbi:MAG: hypothetical protein AAGN82_14550 [Myxococcota bacterium]
MSAGAGRGAFALLVGLGAVACGASSAPSERLLPPTRDPAHVRAPVVDRDGSAAVRVPGAAAPPPSLFRGWSPAGAGGGAGAESEDDAGGGGGGD